MVPTPPFPASDTGLSPPHHTSLCPCSAVRCHHCGPVLPPRGHSPLRGTAVPSTQLSDGVVVLSLSLSFSFSFSFSFSTVDLSLSLSFLSPSCTAAAPLSYGPYSYSPDPPRWLHIPSLTHFRFVCCGVSALFGPYAGGRALFSNMAHNRASHSMSLASGTRRRSISNSSPRVRRRPGSKSRNSNAHPFPARPDASYCTW